MNRDELERELQRVARALGGGWRLEHGVMPVVALTLPEAQAVEERLTVDVDTLLDRIEACQEGDEVYRASGALANFIFYGTPVGEEDRAMLRVLLEGREPGGRSVDVPSGGEA